MRRECRLKSVARDPKKSRNGAPQGAASRSQEAPASARRQDLMQRQAALRSPSMREGEEK